MRFPLLTRRTHAEIMAGLLSANESLSLAVTQTISERDWLRAQLETALDHNRRLERKEAGLTERPREPKEPDPVPEKIRKIISAFGSSLTQEDQMTRAKRAHAEGATWEEIEGFLLAGLNEQ